MFSTALATALAAHSRVLIWLGWGRLGWGRKALSPNVAAGGAAGIGDGPNVVLGVFTPASTLRRRYEVL